MKIEMEQQDPPAELVAAHTRLRAEYAAAVRVALRDGATPGDADRYAMRVTEGLKRECDRRIAAWAATRPPPRMVVVKGEP